VTAFERLPDKVQRGIVQALETRRQHYLWALTRNYAVSIETVLIADKPGPGRPKIPGLNHDPAFHHTPFCGYSHSSLWLNQQLVQAGVDEEKLLWFNAEMADGSPLDPVHVLDLVPRNPRFIALGNNAVRWIEKHTPLRQYIKVHHPQFAKRFKSKEPYELIDILRGL
jgi:hypothetical protein